MPKWSESPIDAPAAPKWASSAPTPEASAAPKREVTGAWERFGEGLLDPLYGAAQLADKTLVNPIRQFVSPGATSMEDVIRERDAGYVAPEGIDWARMGGNVANPINYVGGGAGMLASTPARLAALQGVLQPTQADDDIGTFVAKKGGQAALGAVLGRVLGGATTPEAKALAKQGVRLTPGQAAGGVENSLEQKMTSLPFTGSIIDKSRQRAVTDVQTKAIERGTGIADAPTVREANKAVSDLFEKVVPKLKPTAEGFDGAVNALESALKNPELTAENRKLLQGLINKHLETYPSLDGAGLKRLDSTLGFLARKYDGPNASPADNAVADGIYEVLAGMRDGWTKGLSGEDAAVLAQANRGYRNMIPINRAATTRADEIATPRALQKAFARQRGVEVPRMDHDELIDNAVKALTSSVPDSGTAGRQASMSIPSVATGLVLALPTAAAYSRPGRAILTGKGGPTREALARALAAAARSGANNTED